MTRNEILRRFGNCSEAFIKANSKPEPIKSPKEIKEAVEDIVERIKAHVSPFNQMHGESPTILKKVIAPYTVDAHPIQFTIPGQPVGKPRMTQRDKWMKRPCVMRYRAWCDIARASAPKGMNLAGSECIEIRIFLEIPKSYSKKKRRSLQGAPHRLLGDGDNFLKSAQDALLKQDSGIWKFSGEKRWDDGKGARMEVILQ